MLSWIGLLNRPVCPASPRRAPVSILVVLDRPPPPCRRWTTICSRRGFNPCCPGSASSTGCSCKTPGFQTSFQSLLSWIGLLNMAATNSLTGAVLFQSLLSWIGLLNVTRPARSSAGSGCFNPCCPGSASSTSPSRSVSSVETSFNPCCPGSASSTGRRQTAQRVRECFNPCCPGSASSTLWTGPEDIRPSSVSILVVLDRPPQRCGIRPIAGGRMSFNPCCPGSASSTGRRPQRSGEILCFNPCCPGSASSTMSVRRLWIDRQVFQSLLSWIGLLNMARRSGGKRKKVFQSLLSWIGLLNMPGFQAAVYSYKFQSLLSWIGLLNLASVVSGGRWMLFQSLLSWIGLLNRCFKHGIHLGLKFQSLLSWIGLLNHHSDLSDAVETRVSILVVLDRPPQRWVAMRDW